LPPPPIGSVDDVERIVEALDRAAGELRCEARNPARRVAHGRAASARFFFSRLEEIGAQAGHRIGHALEEIGILLPARADLVDDQPLLQLPARKIGAAEPPRFALPGVGREPRRLAEHRRSAA
jgi:hypothetical protein